MTVWRVTPTRSASSACVISPRAKRSARIAFVTRVGLPPTSYPPPVGHERDDGRDHGHDDEPEVDRVRDPERVRVGEREDERAERPADDAPLAGERAAAREVAVALVGAEALAGAGDLDHDAHDDPGDDGARDRPQQRADVGDV